MDSKRNPVLDVVRIISMIFVLFIHSPGGDPNFSPSVYFLKVFIAGGAVPIFFLLSGYLGARKIDDRTVSLAQYSMEKFRTLIIPFLSGIA